MKKKVRIVLVFIMLFIPLKIEAARGCCSHHGGVSGCSSSGRQICNDGTLSPTSTCTPVVKYNYGCMDRNAKNYDSSADKDDGSCIYYVYGCTDKLAKNYDSKADKDNGTCEYYIYGCMNKMAKNYSPEAEKDDGSCLLSINDDMQNKSNDSYHENEDDSVFLDGIIEISAISGGLYLYNKLKKRNAK